MFLLSFLLTILITPSNFDKGDYMSLEGMEEILESDFSYTITDETEAFVIVTAYMSEHFETVDHLTANYNKESDIYYYTVFGTNDEGKSVELLKVDQNLHENATYYKTSKTFAFGSCRSGFPWYNGPYNVCTSNGCITQTTNCLGVNCPPAECR